MPSEDVVARLRVDGEGPFAQAFARARDAIRGTSQEGEESESSMGRAAKSLAIAGGAAIVARKGYQSLKGAIDTTADLAKSTAAFSRASGLSSKESQAWITVAKTRGIETSQLQMGMAAFGRQLTSTGADGEGASKALARLGVDQKALLAMPMAERMQHVANAFQGMPDGVEKAAAAQALFGRSGQQLLPILNAGAAGLQDNLDAASRLVPPLGKSGEAALDMAKKQREMEMAMLGVKTSIATAFIPILATLISKVTPVITVFSDLIRKSPVLAAAITALGLAFAGMIVITKVITVVKSFTGAMAALNITMAANPIVLVVLAVAALAAGLVIAYQKVGWFRDGVDAAMNAVKTVVSAVFGWIKGNWPLLLGILTGPFGLAVALIIKNFDKIKQAAKDVVEAIKGFFSGLPAAIGSMVGSIGSSIGGALKDAVKAVLPGPLSKLLATGGIIAAQTGLTAGGGKNVLVGERGPEMLTLPSGSRVTPLPPPALAGAQLGGGEQTVVAQVFLERRMIAEALASYTAERQAAR